MDAFLIALGNSAWAIVTLLMVVSIGVLIVRWVDSGAQQVRLLADPVFYAALSILVLVGVSMFRQPLLIVCALVVLLAARPITLRKQLEK